MVTSALVTIVRPEPRPAGPTPQEPATLRTVQPLPAILTRLINRILRIRMPSSQVSSRQ